MFNSQEHMVLLKICWVDLFGPRSRLKFKNVDLKKDTIHSGIHYVLIKQIIELTKIH